MRKTFPEWIRKWALGVLLGITLGSAGGLTAAFQWYGDKRAESTLNSAARQRLTAIEAEIRERRESQARLDVAVGRLATAVDGLSNTLERMTAENRREDDLQWSAIRNMGGRP